MIYLDSLIFPSSLLLLSSQKPATASSLVLLYSVSPSHLPDFHNVPQGVSQTDMGHYYSLAQKCSMAEIKPEQCYPVLGELGEKWMHASSGNVYWNRVVFFLNNLAIFIQMKNTHMAHLVSATSALEIKPLKIRAWVWRFAKPFSRIFGKLGGKSQ